MSNDLLYKEHFCQNREVSWLRFNDRVLNEAKDTSVPLLERLRFVSIFTSNLEEFFMVRVGSLVAIKDSKVVKKDERSGLTVNQQLEKIYEITTKSLAKRDKIFAGLMSKMSKNNIIMMKYADCNKDQKKYLKKYFKENVKPFLNAQIVDAHHPVPNLATGMVHVVANLTIKGNDSFGIVPIMKVLPSIVVIPTKNKIRFMTMQELVENNLDSLFPSASIEGASSMIITRNADVNPDDEAFDEIHDYRKKIRKVLAERKKMSIVHTVVAKEMSSKVKKELIYRLKINPKEIDNVAIPLDINFCSELGKLILSSNIEGMLYEPYTPKLSVAFDYSQPLIEQALKKDVLLHYPYESMEPFIRLVKEASEDPDVVSIKITIYRLAKHAKLVEYLCAAAERGKEVVTLIELKARFDEQNNIDYSERLEDAGCTVLYGFESYKVHSKICQITKMKNNKPQIISMLGTGNFNENTAKLYTDLLYITSNKKIADDSNNFFNNMLIGKLDGQYHDLWVAPVCLKDNLISKIDEEITKGANGRVWIKCNSITDVDIIAKLAEASSAGVDVKLLVRGICCILPQIEGKTDNLEIRSVVGRYLEHSRIYIFGKEETKVYIASADLMTRNTMARVEIACPILDKKIATSLVELFENYWKDNLKARTMSKYGAYRKIEEALEDFNIQQYLMDTTLEATNLPIKKTGKVIESFATTYKK